jgi:hypothetical protein
MAIEVLLGLPPQLEAEAKAGIYRLECNDQWKQTSKGFRHARMTRNTEKEPTLWMGADKLIMRYAYDKSFSQVLNGQMVFRLIEKES